MSQAALGWLLFCAPHGFLCRVSKFNCVEDTYDNQVHIAMVLMCCLDLSQFIFGYLYWGTGSVYVRIRCNIWLTDSFRKILNANFDGFAVRFSSLLQCEGEGREVLRGHI